MSPKSAGHDSHTPAMRQYHAVKSKHPDKLVFFRMGDFYEMFGDDAVKGASLLGIALTSRGDNIPLAGVPYHAVEKYLSRLMTIGEKVVIVEQVENPKEAKGVVKREITEIMTPGTATVDSAERQTGTRWLAALSPKSGKSLGVAALDLSTGEFLVDEGESDAILGRLRLIEPSEILWPSDADRDMLTRGFGFTNGAKQITSFDSWNFDHSSAERDLSTHFGTTTLDGFGVAGCRQGVSAAGAIFRYLKENYRQQLAHIQKLSRFHDDDFMTLDYATVRNLELVRSTSTGDEQYTLFSIINQCATPAGARRLHSSLLRPFKTKARIERRLTGVAELVTRRDLAFSIRELTKSLPDLEKLVGRLGIARLNPRQAVSIAWSVELALKLKTTLRESHSPHLSALGSSLPDCASIAATIRTALTNEPPLATNGGGIIREGYSADLDALNDSIRDARFFIASLQAKERERTGISSLKVGFNNIFGYYIEITRANASLVPQDYIRKQTLVNAERYITSELKEKEDLILGAEEKIFKLEGELYDKLVAEITHQIASLSLTAELLAEIDLVSGLAEVAVSRGYVRPELYEDGRLIIKGGRHSVIESVLQAGEFVSNDVDLHSDDRRIAILTGPNMSGKSTYLRQIGLIVILAHIGSFVPAESAAIGLVDRVFTRVGAIDNLAGGQSTFLVEMVETANILNNATNQSLVLLDEVGRGTSTFDGLSVAWSVVEYINDHNKCRTVFATHYHELTGMATLYPHIHNFQVAVRKLEDSVLFLHQIVPGGCDDSYGIEVARMAGLPRKSLQRAKQILHLLESGKFAKGELGKTAYKQKAQSSLFEPQTSAVEALLRAIDVDATTPLDALTILKELKDKLS
ncbi:MAG: DNA mismatch repair protein MutS [Candidatus Zixiibacteriota bacterium]